MWGPTVRFGAAPCFEPGAEAAGLVDLLSATMDVLGSVATSYAALGAVGSTRATLWS